MLALVAKDILILRFRPLLVIGLGLLVLTAMERPTHAAVQLLGVSLLSVMVVMTHLGLQEEKSRTEVLVNVLASTRRQVVAGRFATMVLLSTFLVVLFTAVVFTQTLLADRPMPAHPLLILTATLGAPLVYCCIWMPVAWTFGATRSQMYFLFLPFLLAGVWGALGRSQREALATALAPLAQQSDLQLSLGVFAATAVALLASYSLCVRLYERRDL